MRLLTAGVLFILLYISPTHAQISNSCFVQDEDNVCCSGTSLALGTMLSYTGNSVTVTFNAAITTGCGAFAIANFDFGDGSATQTLSPSGTNVFTPSHVYVFPNVCAPLIYTVQICLQNDVAQCVQTETIYIPHPQNNFTINATSSTCNQYNFGYSSSSSLINGMWVFGNGASQSLTAASSGTISYTYTTAGTYTAYLTGLGISPCIFSVQTTASNFPGADFTFTVNNSCSTAAGVNLNIANYNTGLYSYNWTINGTSMGSPAGQTSSYTSNLIPGTNTIVLGISDGTCSTNVTKTLSIGNPASFNLSVTGVSCKSATFNCTGTPGTINLQNAQWAFGDGTNSGVNPNSANTVTISHTYPGPGTYIVSVSGIGISPCTLTTAVTISDNLSTNFNYTVVDVCNPANGIILDISNYNPSATYNWQFNQSSTFSQGASATYIGNLVNGANTIKLTITNGAGCTAEASKVVNIGAPLANFSALSPVCINDMLSAYNISPGGDTYQWKIGTGTVQTGMNPAYIFTATGSQPVSLTVTTTYPPNAPCVNSATTNVLVYDRPDASFTTSPVSCDKSVTLTLITPTTAFTSYTIDYGDGTAYTGGSSINSSDLSHTYTTSQTYTTYPVNIYLANGPCTSEFEQSVTINNITNLIVSAPSPYICYGANSPVNSLITGVNQSATYVYSWTGPGGFTSSQPTISASATGLYSLTVTANIPCSMTLTGTQSLTVLADATATLSSVNHIDCSSSSGSATLTISEDLQKDGFIVDGVTTNANPSASGTINVTVNGLVQGNNYIAIANLLKPSCSSVIQVGINKTEPTLVVTTTNPSDCSPGYGSASVSSSSIGTVVWYSQADLNTPITTTTGLSVNNLLAGNYFVQNSFGNCVTTENFSIVNPVINLTKISGQGACSGATTPVTINAQFSPVISGSFNYTMYAMPSGTTVSSGTSNTFALLAGDYVVDVSSNGCSTTLGFEIKTLDPISIDFHTNLPDCNNNGDVTALVSGGDGNYSYLWYKDGIAQTNTTSTLTYTNITSAISISVTVTDASSCTASSPTPALVINSYTPVSLESCSGIGNGNATHISACNISACLEGGVSPYNYKWYSVNTVTQTVTWHFMYDAGGTFIASYGTNTLAVIIPTSTPISLADNADFSLATAMYPFWNTTVTPFVPIMNPGGELSFSTTPSASTNPSSYYTANESIIFSGQENFVSSYSGPSNTPGTTENFVTGEYNLYITDAKGCTSTFSIGSLAFTTPTSFPVSFSYVWGMGRVKPVVEEYDQNLHEDMIEASNELLDQASKCWEQEIKVMKSGLKVNCSDLSRFKDALNVTYLIGDYHYTLYYYDRAGRLTKTVPPQGVDTLTGPEIQSVLLNRSGHPVAWPVQTHSMATTYNYNSFGQLISQNTPDGGTTKFIYDSKNRLRFSQNEQQKIKDFYSYTKYDALGRIVEVGESNVLGLDFTTLSAPGNLTFADNVTAPVPTGTKFNQQITRTFYSMPASVTYYGQPQRYLQNRVSYTMIDENTSATGDEHYTYYSYDAHGNVEWLVQDQPGGIGRNNIAYEYDLVSGKVLKVSYNEKRADRFFHRYVYDAENRLVATETSRNGELWDRDASYRYYPHGPLKRTELGEDHVQGLDYIYTIHGWMKAINSPSLVNASDPGDDNPSTGATLERTAEDRFGMVLNYYNGDYSANNNNFLMSNGNYSLAAYNGTSGVAPSLYNGNISGWIQSQLDVTATTPEVARADLFSYDLLNRIKNSISIKEDAGLGWTDLGTVQTYSTNYTYDANGNITHLERYRENGQIMDDLSYNYDNGYGNAAGLSNKLTQVDDACATLVSGSNDLQATHEYTYDAIGNLITETGQDLTDYGPPTGPALHSFTTNIQWTVYGKIKQVDKITIKNPSAEVLKERITFSYDAAGNRVKKDYWKDDVTSPDGIEDPQEIKTTFYVRDAQGNTMATYERYYDANAMPAPLYKWDLVEQPIYGSDRLGMNVGRITLASASGVSALALPVNGAQSLSEYQNWITTTSKTQLLPSGIVGNTDNLCQCRVISLDLNSTSTAYQHVQDAVELLGVAHNGIALAEDLSGNLQFFVVQAKNYLGAKDACLIFDKDGKLMEGQDKIGTVYPESKPVIVNIPGTSKYAVVTLDQAKQAVYHVVDMGATGYGIVGNMGVIESGSNPLETYPGGSGITHGYHFTGMEDHINGNSIVYSSRFTPDAFDPTKGTTEIMAYNFSTGTVTPQSNVLHSIYGCGNTEQGQLQISPDGNKLGWWQYEKYLAGFTYRNANVYSLPLNSARTALGGVPTSTQISQAGNEGNGMFDFMKNSDNILYSQRGAYKENSGATKYDRNVWNYDPVNLTSLSINPYAPTVSYLFGEIKRGKDGNYYIPNMGKAVDKFHSFSGGSFNANVTIPDTLYKMSSSLPTQVYKVFNSTEQNPEYKRDIGQKNYELKDHLGNVRVVISDAKLLVDADASNTIGTGDEVVPEVLNYTDYYAGGMQMPGRQFNSGDYRYGYGSFEKIDEVNGLANYIDMGDRLLDVRIMRIPSLDGKASKYPHLSPYTYAGNNPIYFLDPDGNDIIGSQINVEKTADNQIKVTGQITIRVQILNLSSKVNGTYSQRTMSDFKKHVESDLGKGTILYPQGSFDISKDCELKNASQSPIKNQTVTYDLDVNIEYEFVDNISEVTNTSHLFVLVDEIPETSAQDIEGSPTIKPVGLQVTDRLMFITPEGYNVRSLYHELLHTLGLPHWWNSKPGDKGQNVMNYNDNTTTTNSEQNVDIFTKLLGTWNETYKKTEYKINYRTKNQNDVGIQLNKYNIKHDKTKLGKR